MVVDTTDEQRFFALNSLGDIPLRLLKNLLKWLQLENPVRTAISSMLRLVDSSRIFAIFNLTSIRRSLKE